MLGNDLLWLRAVTSGMRTDRRPVVLSRSEVTQVSGRMMGATARVARLLYGASMRLMEGDRFATSGQRLTLQHLRPAVEVEGGRGGQ